MNIKKSLCALFAGAILSTLAQAEDWKNEDIGNVKSVGSALKAEDGTWTVVASGKDIWDKNDEFHFIYKKQSGDFSVLGQIESIKKINGWTKAGVMIRESLEENAANAMMTATAEEGVSFQYRSKAGGKSISKQKKGVPYPIWVKVERIGNKITGYFSEDGFEWTKRASTELSLGDEVYVGLAVTSHNNNKATEAIVSNLVIE